MRTVTGPVKVVIRHPDREPLIIASTDAWRNGALDYYRVNDLNPEEAELITVHLAFPDEVYHSCRID